MITNDDFGKQVTATHVLNKEWRSGGQRTWVSLPVSVSGIFIGTRYLQSGYMEHEHGEYGSDKYGGEYWVESGGRIKAALIVENPNKNPVYVPFDCVSLVQEIVKRCALKK